MWTIPGLLCLVAASEAPRAERRRLEVYNYQEVAKLTAADGAAGDTFGVSVAIDGNTVVIGAYEDDSYRGSAYVFRTLNTLDGSVIYGQVAKLTAADGAAGDQFGRSVAIDGNTIVVGAFHYDNGGSGAVYVFRTTNSGATYPQVAKLTASDAATNDYFGYSVAIDGGTVMVGAYRKDDYTGSAYVFRTFNGGATYPQVAKLTASDAAAYDNFGISVAIDGATVVIGARNDDDAGSGSGSAYVFRTSDGGASYGQVVKLTASDAAAGDWFGYSVAIDGGTIVVGAYGDASFTGAVYVFRTSDGGTSYDQVAKLTASDAASSDYFGGSVAIDGATVVVGAYVDYPGGSTYVFRTTDGGATYPQVAKLTAGDAAAGDAFGTSVAIDGDTVVIGASHFLNDGSGSAYVFDPNRPTSQPTPTPTLPPTFRPTLEPTSQPTTQQPTSQPQQQQQQQQLDSVATILICVAAAVVCACGLAYACYVRYGSREGPKSDLEPLAEPAGTTPAPTKEATVLSIPPESELEAEAEAEQPPPPPTNGWFWRGEPKPEPEGEAEETLVEQPPPPPAKGLYFRTEPEIEPEPGETEERPPPLSPFSTLRAERERELAPLGPEA
jgi:hypothetical protein